MTPILPGQFPKLSPRARLQKDKVTGKPVLLYPEGVLMLNTTAHAILVRCTGHETVQQIAAQLAGQHQATPHEVQSDVIKYLDRLRARNLLVFSTEPS